MEHSATNGARPADPAADASETADFSAREVLIHGRRMAYRSAGNGPTVVLIHGMLNSSWHWREVGLRLAKDHHVIAPDLLGHGGSAAPIGDYSLGAHAAGIRDLLDSIGVERATLVGHSLGGGIAMQFYYQFPQRCERFAVISSGGLGREVSWALRLPAVPGFELLLAAVASRPTTRTLRFAAGQLKARGATAGFYFDGVARVLEDLQGAEGRRGFLESLRAVIEIGGQKASARDRLYLGAAVPTLIAWGERDNLIPIEHGREAQARLPGSRFETIPRAAHFPHVENPKAVAAILRDFLTTTEPGTVDPDEWRRMLESAPVE